MDFAHQIILLGAGLVGLSIFAGLVSQRIGAPLLLVFLVLGMLAGEDGPGGLEFGDFETTYLAGSIALCLILFDGGLRTTRRSFDLARWPALVLATAGVLLTAGITGAFASLALGIGWLEGLLVGSIVASTDAAAVFFLLHLRGARLREKVGATLEVESGLNDPMAIFLTVTLVELLAAGGAQLDADSLWPFAGSFALQFAGGALAGVAGGFALLWVVNRVKLAPGLYPIVAIAGALAIFGATQTVGASGFLACYLAGFILGIHRHRATELINRFLDGMAWLAQIAMFLLLGLLVTPTALLPVLAGAFAVALFLVVVGRPLAVLVCLLPFRFTWAERGFVSWIGLRGAVPIYLGTIPVLAGLPGATEYFAVACVVVLVSLLVQGWTVTPAARRLGLELSPRPEPGGRLAVDLPDEIGRDMAAYTVEPRSPAIRRPTGRLPLPEGSSLLFVLRDGTIRGPAEVERLAPGDYVLTLAPSAALDGLDRLFRARPARPGTDGEEPVFVFDGGVAAGALAEFYNAPLPSAFAVMPVQALMGRFLGRRLRNGARLRLGEMELVARKVADGTCREVAVDLSPRTWTRRRLDPLRIRLAAHREARRAAEAQRVGTGVSPR